MTRHLPIALVVLLPWSLVGTASSDALPVTQPWPMHHVCRDFLIANSLNAAEVDGDGDLDLPGNVEEHYHRGPDGKDVSWFSVVWFENLRRHR